MEYNMEVLEFFQDIRNPILTFFARLLSYAASEVLIVTVVCAVIATATLTLAHFKQQKKALEEAKGAK